MSENGCVSYILHFQGICGECPCRSQVLSDNFLKERIKGTVSCSSNDTEIIVPLSEH